jgi:hypothetical protein
MPKQSSGGSKSSAKYFAEQKVVGSRIKKLMKTNGMVLKSLHRDTCLVSGGVEMESFQVFAHTLLGRGSPKWDDLIDGNR